MITHETRTEVKTTHIVKSISCDKCKREIQVDDLESQEIIQIQHRCGYGSIFGDENIIRAEFCQECAKELFGQYLRVEEG